MQSFKPIDIQTQVGLKDISEMFQGIPSVYVSKGSGNLGSSRLTIRGFGAENTALFFNGLLLNDPLDGSVRFGNLATLGDFIQNQSLQKGMGNPTWNFNAIGGSMYLSTQKTDSLLHANARYSYGSNQSFKIHHSFSSGLLKNNWTIKTGFNYQQSEGYVQGTAYQVYAYFLEINKKITQNQQLSFTVFGTSLNNQARSLAIRGEVYDKVGSTHNLNYGQGISARQDVYHKPFFIFKHDWNFAKNLQLESALYYSLGSGYGVLTDINTLHEGLKNVKNKKLFTTLTSNGQVNAPYNWQENIYFEAIKAYNSGTNNPWKNYEMADNLEKNALLILRSVHTNHHWAGASSHLNWHINEQFQFKNGVKLEYYRADNTTRVHDLLGADFYIDPKKNKKVKKGDIISNNFQFQQINAGLFSQVDYKNKIFQGFIHLAAENIALKREDFFKKTPATNYKSRQNWSAQTGLQIPFAKTHQVHGTLSWISRAPYANALFNNSENYNAKLVNQTIYSSDISYLFYHPKIILQTGVYYTLWANRSKNTSTVQDNLNYTGLIQNIDQQHYGFEISTQYQPWYFLTIKSSFSIGNWTYLKDAKANLISTQSEKEIELHYHIKNFKVADAPQLSFFSGLNAKLGLGFWLGLDLYYFDQHYTQYNIENYTQNSSQQVWKIPAYYLIDVHIGWYAGEILALSQIKIVSKINIFLNIYNLSNSKYITEGIDGMAHNRSSSRYFYGQNRAYLLTLSFGL